ncbi:MAG: tRNA (adenosine(37)-N6)-threonylcarbamoyltransferase complex ATPase subunit type 1 TsaE [Burkholderiaceae bacterium]
MNQVPDKLPQDADSITQLLADEKATEAAARRLSLAIEPGTVIHLSGDLGAGKTSFCRALIRSLGYNGRVKSPTFTLVEPYNLPRFSLYHFDFYRFSSGEELRDAGFEEQLDAQCVALVEWPERAHGYLPPPDLLLQLDWKSENERLLRATATSPRGEQCLSALIDAASSGRDSAAPC